MSFAPYYNEYTNNPSSTASERFSTSQTVANRRKQVPLSSKQKSSTLSTYLWLAFVIIACICLLVVVIVPLVIVLKSTIRISSTGTVTNNVCTRDYTYLYTLDYFSVQTAQSYTLYSYTFTTPATLTQARLIIGLRNDAGYWGLDDVSVTQAGTPELSNGGFETGTLSPSWTLCNPQGSTSGKVTTSGQRTGTYYFYDASSDFFDYLSQTFTVTPSTAYVLTLYLSQSITSTSNNINAIILVAL